jgi:hypothetical protein
MHGLLGHALLDAWPDGFERYLCSAGEQYHEYPYVISSTRKVNVEFGLFDICDAYPLDISIS